MTRSFAARLKQAQVRNHSWVCVGLDPVMVRMPESVQSDESPFLSFARAIVGATSDLVCAYKPNLAFWLAEGTPGFLALKDTIALIPEDVPVILDAKFGDVGHTAQALARAAFDQLGAHAVTANPYLGVDALRPFLERADRGVFILARTSNPSAPDVQDLAAANGPVFEVVARLASEWDSDHAGTCGLVVGATYPEELARLRGIAPELPFLVPGVGKQGGDLQVAVMYGTTSDGIGPVINSSRGIIYASQERGYADAARAAALELRDMINKQRGEIR